MLKDAFIFSGCSRPQSFLGFSQMRWRPLPSPGASGCGEVKGNGSSDGADIREPEEPRTFYCRSAFLKVWAGNPRHMNQLELTLKYRLFFSHSRSTESKFGVGPKNL